MPKTKKIKKKAKAKKTKKIKNAKAKLILKTPEKKTNIPGQDEKPEIKKIKKQPTEKKQYNINDYVVYPKHGVGQITEFKKINIGGIDVETYIIKFVFMYSVKQLTNISCSNSAKYAYL